MRKKVYISGPITKGNRTRNLAQSLEAHHALMLAGFAVFNPIPTMQLPFAWDGSLSHDEWLASDLPWVLAADAVLRLPGPSVGADLECDHALRAGIPVYHTVAEIVEHV